LSSRKKKKKKRRTFVVALFIFFSAFLAISQHHRTKFSPGAGGFNLMHSLVDIRIQHSKERSLTCSTTAASTATAAAAAATAIKPTISL
jgi:hypothetical protein